MFSLYDLKYEFSSFRYIGSDGKYAIGRGNQKTTKVKGPAFKDNILDCIYILREEDGKWKLWTQVILETKFLAQKEVEYILSPNAVNARANFPRASDWSTLGKDSTAVPWPGLSAAETGSLSEKSCDGVELFVRDIMHTPESSDAI